MIVKGVRITSVSVSGNLVRPGSLRLWSRHNDGPAHNCHECGRIIVPGAPRWFDETSGHIARHVQCHERAESTP